MCTDLGSLGFAATDGHGNPVKASCGNGAPTDCNDADPKASCAAFSNPICAHVDIGGSEIVSCGQICTP